ncbi:hypothetical protein FGG08_007523 [Glutinoglossum americanum]|uniref:Biogenesis of lysosome-related organelles complex 1 subunit CNL1 n=1 Tax=Glutinoglossum americanum TaxID=1670608 RepID=A0A9P8HZ92_9PEZI|nr:hypothetical protein FGG08_007523 [Glutinoglossum americanum]
MASPAPSIPDTQLGLSPDEVALLRRHQPLALSHLPHGRGASPSPSTRTTSTNNPPPHALLLDPRSLSALAYHFDRLLLSIQERVQQLNAQTTMHVNLSRRGAVGAMEAADMEIRRFREVLRQIEELEGEFEKVRRVGEIVRGWRGRVERLEGRFGR